MCNDRYDLFLMATRRWWTFLKEELNGKVGARDMASQDFEKLRVPTGDEMFRKPGESEIGFENRLKNTLTVDNHFTINLGVNEQLSQKYNYLKKLWVHVFKKHLPHCLGQTFVYRTWHVHWPIPNFNEEKKQLLRKVLIVAAVIFFLGIILDALFGHHKTSALIGRSADYGDLPRGELLI